jgi:hypothetical protein
MENLSSAFTKIPVQSTLEVLNKSFTEFLKIGSDFIHDLTLAKAAKISSGCLFCFVFFYYG